MHESGGAVPYPLQKLQWDARCTVAAAHKVLPLHGALAGLKLYSPATATATARARGTLSCPDFAYKGLNNKDTLHIKHYTIRTLCISRTT